MAAVEHLNEKGFVPGTVHLVDLEGTLRAKHAPGAGNKDIVLVPSPVSLHSNLYQVCNVMVAYVLKPCSGFMRLLNAPIQLLSSDIKPVF